MPLGFTGNNRTAVFRVLGGLQYDFDVIADRQPREQDSMVSEHLIPPGAPGLPVSVYMDLGGYGPQHNTIGCFFLTDAEFETFELAVNYQGILITVLDGQYNAVLKRTRRTKRWASGQVEADAEFWMWR